MRVKQTLGDHAVRAVGARNDVQRIAGIVVGLVVRDRDRRGGGRRCERSGSSEEEGSDRGEELHYGDVKEVTDNQVVECELEYARGSRELFEDAFTSRLSPAFYMGRPMQMP